MKTLFAVAVAAVLASGCASALSRTTGDRVMERYAPYIGEPIRGFTAFRMQSWQPVSRNQLILWTGMNDAYLLTVTDTCPDMMFANTVRVTSTGSRVSTLDAVLVRKDRCLIQKIEPIDIRAWRRDRDANKRQDS